MAVAKQSSKRVWPTATAISFVSDKAEGGQNWQGRSGFNFLLCLMSSRAVLQDFIFRGGLVWFGFMEFQPL